MAANHVSGDYGAHLILGNVVPRAFERIGGTILGAALGLVALRPSSFLTADAGVVCDSDVLCGWLALGKKPYQALLIGITLAVVVGAPAGDMDTALWRGGDVILGSLLAMLFTGIWPQRAFCTGASNWRIASRRIIGCIRQRCRRICWSAPVG